MNLPCLLRTLQHLRLRQIVWQVVYRLYKPQLREGQAVQAKVPEWVEPIPRWTCVEGEQFDFLNLKAPFNGWCDTARGMLWAYNLNYMDFLLQPGMQAEEGTGWIDRFIDELPQNSVGQDPYPIALRGINWIKFIISHHHELSTEAMERWNGSLSAQYDLLGRKLEYHLLGNHLLEDAFSLFFGAIYLGHEQWYKKACRLLKSELEEQILPDGAHYEQSPMYHCILLDRLLDCYNMAAHLPRFEGQAQMQTWLGKKAGVMLGHMEQMLYADGTYPLLNDAAQGIAPTPEAIADYARRLGVKAMVRPLKECGYRRMQNARMELFADAGAITATYQPGHTHADIFNFELRIDGEHFIVDTGISTYDKTPRRQYERSTAAHNTVCLPGCDSLEVWGGFRVGRRARVHILHDERKRLEAEHNGFGNKRIHRRTFEMQEEGLLITDRMSSPEIAQSRLHLAPGTEVLKTTGNMIYTSRGTLDISGAERIEIVHDTVSTHYNQPIPCAVVVIHFRREASIYITTRTT